MDALYLRAHGGPEVVAFGALPDPVPAAGEVCVAVKAAAMNHLDVWVRKGWPALKLAFPHVCGADAAGVVASVGAGVDASLVGTRVVIVPGVSCGSCARCLSGRENLCRSFHLHGEHRPGVMAGLVCVPRQNVVPLPERVSFEVAAALPVTFQTAWHMLVARAPVGPGDVVLVHAAGSGVGSAAIQIAKLHGATVIATTGSASKVEKARALGADHVVLTTGQDFLEATKKLTGKRGVDVVFEHTGAATFDRSVRSLASGGRLVTCGATSGHDVSIDLRYLFARQVELIGSTMGTRAELVRILDLVAAGKLSPVIDRVRPLSEGRDAQEALSHRDTFGKQVLVA